MITREIKKLLQRLNVPTTTALEAAVGVAITREHYEVRLEHLLLKLLDAGDTDISRILAHAGIDEARLRKPLNDVLEALRSGNTGRPSFSPELLHTIEEAWVIASIHHELTRVRSGALVEAILQSEGLQTTGYAQALKTVNLDDLRGHFVEIVAGSVESDLSAVADKGGGPAEGSALDRFTDDVTGRARDGKIDPVSGRDNEIRQMIDILSRRRKNNPILVGEAGVGKTAVLEGLALRIAAGDVPEHLKNVDIRGLDLGLLQAGASVKGEFEKRLKAVIQEVREAATPTILFIDEAHTLIGAGGAAGTSDAANLLKPALARGELRTVAATTFSEYKKYIEKDPALERRFQMIKIEEPSVENAITMLRGIKGKFEQYHGIPISDAAVSAAVMLAERFISGRQLPDKAVDLLDTAAARVKMARSAMPSEIDNVERKLFYLGKEMEAIEIDLRRGVANPDGRLEELKTKQSDLQQKLATLTERWAAETDLVSKIQLARDAMAAGDGADTEDRGLTEMLLALSEIQSDSPLVHAEVNEAIAAAVVADWTGIPAGRMAKDEASVLLQLEDRLKASLIGQDEAIAEIADSIRSAKAGMGNPDAPIAVFLFAGPSGVGKTETARMIAEELFGGEEFLTVINMSEYQESHTVSQLKGSPPGYVGYGEGGILTEAVRRQPYSVVLLDEVEKAHKDVMNLFYQVFDKGFMRDGEGREINFRNTVIMMTSNLGSETISYVVADDERPGLNEVRGAIHKTLADHFQPALLGRMTVVPFYPLSKSAMKGITRLKLGRIDRRLRLAHGVAFAYDDTVVDGIAERCTEVDTGARNIDFIVDRQVLPEASRALIGRMAEDRLPQQLTLGLADDGKFTYTFQDD